MRVGSRRQMLKRDWQSRIDKAVVITKIVVVGAEGEDLLTETTRYTNSQNAVGEKDFIALEKDFRTWAPMFNSRYGVFLEIQRGAWEARRAFQKQNPTATPLFAAECECFRFAQSLRRRMALRAWPRVWKESSICARRISVYQRLLMSRTLGWIHYSRHISSKSLRQVTVRAWGENPHTRADAIPFYHGCPRPH